MDGISKSNIRPARKRFEAGISLLGTGLGTESGFITLTTKPFGFPPRPRDRERPKHPSFREVLKGDGLPEARRAPKETGGSRAVEAREL